MPILNTHTKHVIFIAKILAHFSADARPSLSYFCRHMPAVNTIYIKFTKFIIYVQTMV